MFIFLDYFLIILNYAVKTNFKYIRVGTLIVNIIHQRIILFIDIKYNQITQL